MEDKRDSFAKRTALTVFWVLLTLGWFVSGRPMEIARPRRRSARGAAALTAGARLRGGELAGESQNSAPVHGLAWDLAQELDNDMRGPPEATFGHEMARSGVFGGEGGSAWRLWAVGPRR